MTLPDGAHGGTDRRTVTPEDFAAGPLAPFLAGTPRAEIAAASPLAPDRALVFAGYRLQDLRDYRAALQAWFGALRIGGHLVVVVPHAFLRDRRDSLPTPWSAHQLRLYTPRALLDEIEEALVPNSYRVRWAGDCDRGYDYARGRDEPPVGEHDVAVVVERIVPPGWELADAAAGDAAGPDYAFEPPRTRVERATTLPRDRILALKLDHLGDFVMGIPALRRLRAAFPAADITLVAGSWNRDAAVALGLFDRVVPFDAYPRNSGEEEPDPRGRLAMFDALVTGDYDLAIDLRTDPDTRIFLKNVRARIKAGLGTRSAFPQLDIFLPVDLDRHRREAVEVMTIGPDAFSCQDHSCTHSRFQIACRGGDVSDDSAIVWGPYRRLRAGRHIFEPFLELDRAGAGLLRYDVALDRAWIMQGEVPAAGELRLAFDNPADGAQFEFRFWPARDAPVRSFQFFGGRLVREGAPDVLHQSEYASLLVELVAMRMVEHGVLREGDRVA